MMAAQRKEVSLIDRLPPVRGRLRENVPLAPMTWFRVGGPADVLFTPEDEDDLAAFLAGVPKDVPVTVLGVGSNLLVRDGGIEGVVIRLGRGFTRILVEEDENVLSVGARALDLTVARMAFEAAIGGLEFLAGIPGTIGGALRMNGGAYGREMVDVLIEADALDAAGGRHRLSAAEMGFSYRHSDVPGDWVFVGARLQGYRERQDKIAQRITDISSARSETQPTRARTGGSTFTNPPGSKAWELIDRAGCRGLQHGGAMGSEQHCNFLINTGYATAADIEALGEDVRRRVLAATGVELSWEIRRIGRPLPAGGQR
ncbi:MAG: UDP-N-acetylenolpyruvoylglucosamine reductase [Rhodospirillaceae bacterium]|nr:UDP-N-acetylenolpyruvoylglucosamine reductase [Rhodospirillaceae bacterium]